MSRQSHMQFQRLGEDGHARRGRLVFPRGTAETPAFMPVGTYGTVKGMLPRDIRAIGAEIILGNTFHLWLRPGTKIIEEHGVDLSKSWFYTDSITDQPLMDLVGHPVAVNPDPMLYREAIRRSWPVRFFESP